MCAAKLLQQQACVTCCWHHLGAPAWLRPTAWWRFKDEPTPEICQHTGGTHKARSS